MQLRRTLQYGIAILACGLYAASANADPITAKLFYTTIAGPPNNVGTAVVTLSGSSLTVNNNTPLASLDGAAGIIFAPDGNLLIGGQREGFGGGTSPARVHEITPAGVFVGDGTLPPGNGAYHLALDPTTDPILRVLCNGCGAHYSRFLPLNNPITGQVGTSVGVFGPEGADLNITSLTSDAANNTWYYGATPSGSTAGQFGTITFGEGAGELHIFPGTFAAYNVLSDDPFSNTIILDSGNTVEQFDPTANAIVASITIPGEQFDQAAVDGNGHLFVASNTGDLLGVDYNTATGHLINGAGATHAVSFLTADLGGIALQETVVTTTPEPASLALLGTGLVGLSLFVVGWSRR